MKLPEGKTVYVGRKKFTGEIPDELAKELGLTGEKETKKPTKKPEAKTEK